MLFKSYIILFNFFPRRGNGKPLIQTFPLLLHLEEPSSHIPCCPVNENLLCYHFHFFFNLSKLTLVLEAYRHMHLNKDLDNSEMCSELHISIPFIVDSCSQIPFKVIKVSFVLNSCENKNYISELSKG
jgi:hypothetical protein